MAETKSGLIGPVQSELISDAPPMVELGVIGVTGGPLHRVYTILERAKDFIFFTPALLVTHGRMPCDPVQEFVARFNISDNDLPFCVDLQPDMAPFFAGLGSSVIDGRVIDWDRRLYGVSKTNVDNCFNFIGGIGVHDAKNFYASAISYEIDIPIAPALPLLPIHVFGVLIDGNVFFLNTVANNCRPAVMSLPLEQIKKQPFFSSFKNTAMSETDLREVKGEE